jgi:histidine triad (HIT) family protein
MAVVGLEVPHVHVHLIPIDNMDDMQFIKKVKLTPEEMLRLSDKIAEKIEL